VKGWLWVSFGLVLLNRSARGLDNPPGEVKCVTSVQLPDRQPKKQKQAVDLADAVHAVKEALDCYQTEIGSDTAKKLPKLASVSLDFKATTAFTGGVSLSILVLKFGASRETDVTDDVTFTYQPHKTESQPGRGLVKPPTTSLYSGLVKEVEAAAKVAATQSTLLSLPLDKVGVTVSYGVKYDVNAAVSVPIQLVTISGNGDYNKNNTQSLTLTFADPGKP